MSSVVVGQVWLSRSTGNRYLIREVSGEWIVVEPLQGIWKGDTHRWHVGSLVGMEVA